MNELLILALTLLAGIPLGFFFFGGLWWTIKKGIASQRPVLWFFGSLLVRIAVTMAGFYAVAGGHWERAVMCLAGFLIARYVVMRVTKTLSVNKLNLIKEVDHEN